MLVFLVDDDEEESAVVLGVDGMLATDGII